MTYSIKRGRLSKRRTFSVFDDMEGVSVSNIRTGELAPDGAMGRMQVECVFHEGKNPEKATPIAIYIVLMARGSLIAVTRVEYRRGYR